MWRSTLMSTAPSCCSSRNPPAPNRAPRYRCCCQVFHQCNSPGNRGRHLRRPRRNETNRSRAQRCQSNPGKSPAKYHANTESWRKRQLCDHEGPSSDFSRSSRSWSSAWLSSRRLRPMLTTVQPGLVANPVDHVDTLVGTGTGGETVGEINNFPGATVPFGMVQYSPDTVGDYAGYNYGNSALHRVQHDPRVGGLRRVRRHLHAADHHPDRLAAVERVGEDRPRRHRAGRARLLHRAVPRHRRDRGAQRQHPHRRRPIPLSA